MGNKKYIIYKIYRYINIFSFLFEYVKWDQFQFQTPYFGQLLNITESLQSIEIEGKGKHALFNIWL